MRRVKYRIAGLSYREHTGILRFSRLAFSIIEKKSRMICRGRMSAPDRSANFGAFLFPSNDDVPLRPRGPPCRRTRHRNRHGGFPRVFTHRRRVP
jgi:hypothetical protein